MGQHTRWIIVIQISVTIAYSSGSPQEVDRSRSFFGCSSDIKQTLTDCLGKCQNVSCQSQELQNFLSACKSGTKQICTTEIKPDPICNPLCVNGKCEDGQCKCVAGYKGSICTEIIDECDQCGVANTRTNKRSSTKRKSSTPRRISRGKKVRPPRKYPWQVGLQPARDGDIFCGGSIINSRWIRTAAHCIINIGEPNSKCEPWGDLKKVIVGEHEQNTKTDDDPLNTRVYDVKRYVLHDYWVPQNNVDCSGINNDFALVELKSEIPFNSVIRPVCLPKDDSKTYAGIKATVSGWGVTQKQTVSDVLREAKVNIAAQSNCKGWGNLPDEQLCAVINSPVKDACAGDSGGPLVVKEGNRYIQVGVVSYGGTCGTKHRFSGVYSRVSKVLEWIKETTASGKC